MPRQPPNHRALRVYAQAQARESFEGDHPHESALFQILKGRESPIALVQDALDWYRDEGVRHVLDALMLAKASDALIGAALDLAPETLSPYRHLFFDRAVFRHALEALRYVQEVQVTVEAWREYYRKAVLQGPEFLANEFRVGERPEVDPRRVKRVVMADQYERFLEHRGLPLVENGEPNPVVREAMKYGAQAASTAAEILHQGEGGSESAAQQLRIILTSRIEHKQPEDLGIKPGDVVG